MDGYTGRMDSILCIDVGGSYVKYANVYKGESHDFARFAAPDSAESLLDSIASLVDGAEGSIWALALPGSVKDDIWTASAAYGLMHRSVDLAAAFTERSCPRPVWIAHDAAASARGEALLRPRARRLAVVNVGTGLGGSIVFDGWPQPYMAQEAGHINVIQDGEICSCGRSGCLQAYSGWADLERRYGSPLQGPTELKERAADNDLRAVELIEQATHSVALFCAMLASVCAPDEVILTGGTARALFADDISALEEHYRGLYLAPSGMVTPLRMGEREDAALCGLYDMAGGAEC